jgi:NADPH:quinone reductase
LLRIVDLMARRGRIVIIAGRQAQPTFPVGPFYLKDLSLFGFTVFNASPEEQCHCAEDINRWLLEKKLHVEIGRTFPLAEAAAAHLLLEESSLQKTGAVTGKIVVIP